MKLPRGLTRKEHFEGDRETLIWMLGLLGFNTGVDEIRYADTDVLTNAVEAETGFLRRDATHWQDHTRNARERARVEDARSKRNPDG